YIPGMQKGDILGHEFMGEVVEVGDGVRRRAVGDRVVVAFTIACGQCFFCARSLYSCCDNTNPDSGLPRRSMASQIGVVSRPARAAAYARPAADARDGVLGTAGA